MHIFVSYARADEDFIRRLSVVLCAVGLRPWIDTSGIPSGTPQWDRMVRHAIREAQAVLVLCSEHSRDSEFVAIEIEIAKGYHKKIFPVWVSGAEWSQSAAVALTLSQRVDLRDGHRRAGVTQLIADLKQHLASAIYDDEASTPWPFTRIEWRDAHFHLNPFCYKDWGELLSVVYLTLLKDHFAPFSYGSSWVLELSGASFEFGAWPMFALPAKWAARPLTGVHDVDLAWVHSQADVTMTSTIPSAQANDARLAGKSGDPIRSRATVIDLQSLPRISEETRRYDRKWDEEDQRLNFVGVYCGCRTFWTLAAAAHPKLTVMRLSAGGRIQDFASEAFGYFQIDPPRFQGVIMQSEYFARALEWQLSGEVTKRDTNIFEYR